MELFLRGVEENQYHLEKMSENLSSYTTILPTSLKLKLETIIHIENHVKGTIDNIIIQK